MPFESRTIRSYREPVRVAYPGGALAACAGLPACRWLQRELRGVPRVWLSYRPLLRAENCRGLNPQCALADGLPLPVILTPDVSFGADKLMGCPGLVSLHQLKRWRWGNVTRPIVLPQALPVDRQVVVSQARQIDVVISDEQAVLQFPGLGMQPPFDRRHIPNTVLDVLPKRCDALNWRIASAVQPLMVAHFRALNAFERVTQETSDRRMDAECWSTVGLLQ